MPGVLIEDMPFSLDSVSSGSSPFFESSAGFYTHHHHQLSSVTSSGEQTSPSVPAIMNSTTTATTTNNNGNNSHSNNNNNSNYFRCSHTDYLHQQQHPPSLLETLLAVSSPQSSPSSSSMESLSPRGAPHDAVASALHRFLPSNNDESSWSAEDVYSCDEFRMFEFKVRRCMRGRSHDWTECPFAHPGEKARRRDPRRFHYSGTACPDFRKGNCKNGDACELAHGVFECWLHPARYRTQPCKDGRSCKRRVCFFAHTAEQLRLLSTSSGSSTTCSPSSVSMSACTAASDSSSSPCSSPRRSANPTLFRSLSESNKSFEPIDSSSPSSAPHCCCSHSQYRAACCGGSSAPTRLTTSPTSTLVGLGQSPPPLSPPLSPTHSPPMSPSSCVPRRHIDTRRLFSAPSSPCTAVHHQAPGSKTMCELVTALQQLELQKSLQHNPSWIQCSQASYSPSPLRPTLNTSGIPCSVQQRGVSLSLPATPTKPRWEPMWEMDLGEEEMVIDGEMMAASLVSPRVESGRELRAKIYGRLAGRGGEALPTFGTGASLGEPSPDLNWVNDLVMD